MSSTIIIKNRLGGAQAFPGGTMTRGETALYYPGAAGATTKPTLYACDGKAWRIVNPDFPNITVSNKAISGSHAVEADGNSAKGAGWPWVVGPAEVPLVTHGGITYAFVGGPGTYGAGGTAFTPAMFVSLGQTLHYASTAEVVSGTSSTAIITAKSLRTNAIATPTGSAASHKDHLIRLDTKGLIDYRFIPAATTSQVASASLKTAFVTPAGLHSYIKTAFTTAAADRGRIVGLDTAGKIDKDFLPLISAGPAAGTNAGKPVGLAASGKIDPALLPALGTTLRGGHDFTRSTQPVPAAAQGDIFFASKSGTGATAYKGAHVAMKSGDMVLFDGTNWHVIPNEADLSNFVIRSGHNAMTARAALIWSPPATKTAIINGGNKARSEITNCTIDLCIVDGGTY